MDLGVKPKSSKNSGKKQRKEVVSTIKEEIVDEMIQTPSNVVVKTEYMETDIVRINEGKMEEKEPHLNAYYCVDFGTPTPIPGLAVVFASSMEEARIALNTKLMDSGLDPYEVKKFTLIPLRNDIIGAFILSDGRDLLK